MAASKLMLVAIVFAIASFRLPSAAAQTRHVVGGAIAWNVPTGGAAAYTTWASGQTFNVGDTLFFNFTTGFHDVTEVSQAAYGPCTAANPTSQATTGPATITLRTPGNHYYICSVGTHCQLGQKVTINVGGATAGPPAGSTTPAPAGSTTPPPPPTPTPTPTPPSPSSASSFSSVVPVALVAVGLGFFY